MATDFDADRSHVVHERRDGFHIVRMARPEKRNAMNRAGRQDLLKAFERSAAEGARVVILTGTDRSFCSGVDLVERADDLKAGRPADPASDWIELVTAIRQHPGIFIAAVNGMAMGGGASFINVCDLAIASEEAWISSPEMGFGAFAHFSGPGAQFQVLPKHAAWMLYTTERVDGAKAAAWGLVNECVSPEELMPRAEALAAKVAAFDPVALTETKWALERTPGAEVEWRAAFEYGQRVNERIRERTNAQGIGLSAFANGGRAEGQGS
jgi:enoyl-CoA hydratase/carnithine racemase